MAKISPSGLKHFVDFSAWECLLLDNILNLLKHCSVTLRVSFKVILEHSIHWKPERAPPGHWWADSVSSPSSAAVSPWPVAESWTPPCPGEWPPEWPPSYPAKFETHRTKWWHSGLMLFHNPAEDVLLIQANCGKQIWVHFFFAFRSV